MQRPLPQTVRTRASSAATNKSRALLAQGNTRSSPRLPLLQLSPPPKETVRPAPAMRLEHGFLYSRRQRSPSIEPDYDEDDAWWDALAEGAKESLRDIPTETIQVIESTDSVPGSSVGTMGEPQGDQHITTSSSLVIEVSDDVSTSTTMSTSTAMVVEETPSAMHGTGHHKRKG